jgi:hypothetical protein
MGALTFKVGGATSLRDSISTDEKLGMVMHACHPRYLVTVNRKIMVQEAQV